MSRNRFEEILSFIHLADNANLDKGDKFAKVTPFVKLINKKCVKNFPSKEQVAVDESMIPYFGRHSAKQYIMNQPIRFGYKVWVIATRNGYCIVFIPYVGKGLQIDKELGLGGSVVVELVSKLPENGYDVYFDNFFTSTKLLSELSRRGIRGTGTCRSNRTQKCPLATDLKKKPRGSYDYMSDPSSNLLVCQWHDNNLVTMASNCHGIAPLQKAERWSLAEKKKIQVTQPFLVSQYNAWMGGVDQMDQNIAVHRTSIRKRKWWWPFFPYILDLCTQNAWTMFRENRQVSDFDQLSFIREVVDVYSKRYLFRPSIHRGIGRTPAVSKRVPADARFDGIGHYCTPTDGQRRKCGQCKERTQISCIKCDIGLHAKCFISFHTPAR